MANFYQRSQLTASRLLKKFKQGETIYNHKILTGDEWNPSTATISYTVTAVQAPAARKKQYIDGSLIESNDLLLVVSKFAIEPELTGTMTVNGSEYQVVMVDSPVIETSTPLVWFVGLRR